MGWTVGSLCYYPLWTCTIMNCTAGHFLVTKKNIENQAMYQVCDWNVVKSMKSTLCVCRALSVLTPVPLAHIILTAGHHHHHHCHHHCHHCHLHHHDHHHHHLHWIALHVGLKLHSGSVATVTMERTATMSMDSAIVCQGIKERRWTIRIGDRKQIDSLCHVLTIAQRCCWGNPQFENPYIDWFDECDCFSAKSSVLTGVGATIVSITVNASMEGGEEQLW